MTYTFLARLISNMTASETDVREAASLATEGPNFSLSYA